MMLKRHYDAASLAAGQPRITHVEVLHTGLTAAQNFDDELIQGAIAAGWATLVDQVLELKTDAEPLRYTVKRGPGYFCKSTGESIPMSERDWLKFRLANDSTGSRAAALAWLEANGKQPHDYDISVTYQCVLDAELHDRFRAVRDPLSGNVVAAHSVEA